jgi:hypothetical protein
VLRLKRGGEKKEGKKERRKEGKKERRNQKEEDGEIYAKGNGI